MTAVRRDGGDTPFGDWIRRHPALDSIKERLSIQDQDYWIHQYRAHHDCVGARAVDSIMLLELKTFGRHEPFAQRDTMVIVDQLLRFNNGKLFRSYRRVRGPYNEIRVVRCFGRICFSMSRDRPDNSDDMLWNGVRIDEAQLVELLRFERDPHFPAKRLEYRRHHTATVVQLPLLQLLIHQDHVARE